MARPERTALVLVDVVQPAVEDPQVFSRLGEVLQAARTHGYKVVHVWSGSPGETPPLTDPAVEPRPGEPVLPNSGLGAWSGAGLGGTLAAGKVEAVVLAGRSDSPAWWATVGEALRQNEPAEVISDGRPDHDARLRSLLAVPPGVRQVPVVDARAWVAAAGSRPSAGRKRGVAITAVVAAVALLAAAVVYAQQQARNYYVFSPGSAPLITTSASCASRNGSSGDLTLPDGTPCARLVVPGDKAHPLNGKLFMVDVLVGRASPLEYALARLHLLGTFSSGSQLLPAREVLGTTPPSQQACQDAQQMSGATEDASVAALSRLGYSVSRNQLGALVVQVDPGTPAAAAGVHCNDLVTAVGSRPIRTAEDLVGAIHAAKPGSKVDLTVSRPASGGAPTTVHLQATLSGTPAEPASDAGPATPARPGQAFLGIGTQTKVTYSFPFHVGIDVGDIGGPSAGLALTLGLLDVLSNGQLTGGHNVAATGTMSPDGTVGPIGGVAQKTVAVQRAGADVFFVPPQNYATAKAHATGGLQVMAVSSLSEALDDLARLGGKVPPATSPSTTAPSTTVPPTTVPSPPTTTP